MELSDFSRILLHLRIEKGVSQKTAAQELKVSQSLLSHYEKGTRECGLLFLVRAAEYYGVSTDYLLGRTYEKDGKTISLDEIPEQDTARGNSGVKSMLPTLNKKLMCNSISVIMSFLTKLNNKNLTNEVCSYLNLSIYKMFRMLYNSSKKNDQTLFGADVDSYSYMVDASQKNSEARIVAILKQIKNCDDDLFINESILKNEYSEQATSLFNLLQNSENKIGARKK